MIKILIYFRSGTKKIFVVEKLTHINFLIEKLKNINLNINHYFIIKLKTK